MISNDFCFFLKKLNILKILFLFCGFINVNNCSYFNPIKLFPVYDFMILYSDSSLKYLLRALLDKMTLIFSFEYLFIQFTLTYSIFLLTARALLAGNVQGVVVQARKYVFFSDIDLNITVTVKSFIFL